MSDWYTDSNDQNVTPGNAAQSEEAVPPAVEEPATPETPAVRETAAPAAEQPTVFEQPQTPYASPQTGGQSYYGGMPYARGGYYPYGAQRPPYQPPQTEKKKSSNAPIIILAVLCVLSIVVTVVVTTAFVLTRSSGNTSQSNAVTQQDAKPNEGAPTLEITDSGEYDDGGLSTSAIVANNLDSTVVLTMYQSSSWGTGYYGYDYGDGDDLSQVGAATGIIYSEDGYIITNSHCVYDEESGEEYERIVVTLYNGNEYDADIIGYDPITDLAVIKINETGLSVAEFGDSSSLNLGDRVVTLGNSGGLEWSASQGILSGQARDVYEDTGYAIKCLQVDAVINPGSSGGPLLNACGQVVGVNSAKIVMTGYEGLGFSIPINEAKAVIDDLARYGYVRNRVSLGIMGRTITSIGYEGFMIESIDSNSALANTDAERGDIITHVNGVRVTTYAEMRAELTSYNVGDTVTLTLLRLDRNSRETKVFDVKVTLQESK